MRQIVVVAAIIEKNDKILIVQRSTELTTLQAGMWEFPGGKVEHGESPEDALHREIREELAMEINELKLYAVTAGMLREDLHAIMITYRCKSRDPPTLLVGHNYKWIISNELKNYEFALLDKPIITKLHNHS